MLILIADDDAHLRKILKMKLLKDGYEVILVSDGQEAFDKLEKQLPDLVVTDLMMPGVSGLELLKFIKSKKEKDIPVIVVSGFGQEDIVQDAFSLGADDFIVKPFSLPEFALRLKRLAMKVPRPK